LALHQRTSNNIGLLHNQMPSLYTLLYHYMTSTCAVQSVIHCTMQTYARHCTGLLDDPTHALQATLYYTSPTYRRTYTAPHKCRPHTVRHGTQRQRTLYTVNSTFHDTNAIACWLSPYQKVYEFIIVDRVSVNRTKHHVVR